MKEKKKVKIQIILIISIFCLWIIIGLVDFCLVKSFKEPIFCVGKNLAQDGGSGHYVGLGYSFDIKGNFMPDTEFPGVTVYTYYIFEQKVTSQARE